MKCRHSGCSAPTIYGTELCLIHYRGKHGPDEGAILLDLATRASPGEWHLDPDYRGWIFAAGNYIATTHRGRESMIVANARYIAYASPARIKRLLGR